MIRTISEGVTLADIGLPEGFFNAAATDLGGGLTELEGRYVTKGAKDGDPDEGETRRIVVNSNGIVGSPLTLWKPHGGDTLEDERSHDMGVWSDGDEQGQDPLDERVIRCFTRVAMMEGDYEPLPAIAFSTKRDSLEGRFSPTNLIQFHAGPLTPLKLDDFRVIPGKNVTPFYQLEDGSFEIAFRPNAWDHSFLAVEVGPEGITSNVRSFGITEPDRPEWMSYRAGLCNSPFWINSTEALVFLHGIKKVLAPGSPILNKVPDPNPGVLKKIPIPSHATLKYEYALGTARLTRSRLGRYGIDNISPEPLVVPNDWPDRIELHPDLRNVVYMVGAVANNGAIEAYPQFGDTKTVRMTVSRRRVQDIIQGWDREPQFMAA